MTRSFRIESDASSRHRWGRLAWLPMAAVVGVMLWVELAWVTAAGGSEETRGSLEAGLQWLALTGNAVLLSWTIWWVTDEGFSNPRCA